MSQFFQIHQENPQLRLVKQVVERLNAGEVIVYPTDSGYALGCLPGNKGALDRIIALRRLDDRHNFTLVCRDLSDVGIYGKFDSTVYRLIKALTPGPYTFIVPATREVPRRLLSKRKTIGLRVPDNAIAQAILAELGGPLMSTTLIMPGQSLPETDPYEIRDLLQGRVDLIIDGGYGGSETTTVVSFEEGYPQVLRRGLGSCELFEES